MSARTIVWLELVRRHTGATAEELHRVLLAFVINRVRHQPRSVAHGALVGCVDFLCINRKRKQSVRDIKE